MVVIGHSLSFPVVDPEIVVDELADDDDPTASGTTATCPTSPRAHQEQDSAADDRPTDIIVATSPGDRPVLIPGGPEALLRLATPSTSSIVSWIWSLLRLRYLITNPFSAPADHSAPTSDCSAAAGDEGRRMIFTAVLAILPLVATAMGAILPDLKDTVGGWSAAPRAAYGVAAVAAVALMAVGVMAAVSGGGYGNRAMLSVSAFCSRLGAMLSSALLVVCVSCKLGPWGCAVGVPVAVVVAVAMAAVWKLAGRHGRAVARAASRCRRHVECLHRRRLHRRGVLPVTTRRSD